MYLFRLADRVARGLRALPQAQRDAHRRFLLTQQMPDGGFRGRDGDSDLYYTGFAVRALAITGGLEVPQLSSLEQYLARFDPQKLGVIDLLSWLYSALVVQASGGRDLLAASPPDVADRIAAAVERNRTRDGGYAKAPDGAMGSTYQSFLVTLTLELFGRVPPRRNSLVQFLFDRQRDDGGFVEIAPMKHSGTNPTAAAVALLRLFDALDPDLTDDVLGFLTDVISPEGGFQANTRIPFADGLSTFTALLTAQDLGHPGVINPTRVHDWVVGSLELPSGGFRGAAWDQQADAEYTFYGLGILGLLNGMPD